MEGVFEHKKRAPKDPRVLSGFLKTELAALFGVPEFHVQLDQRSNKEYGCEGKGYYGIPDRRIRRRLYHLQLSPVLEEQLPETVGKIDQSVKDDAGQEISRTIVDDRKEHSEECCVDHLRDGRYRVASVEVTEMDHSEQK